MATLRLKGEPTDRQVIKFINTSQKESLKLKQTGPASGDSNDNTSPAIKAHGTGRMGRFTWKARSPKQNLSGPVAEATAE